MFYHSIKKKIRGWKRHKRKIGTWKQNFINLDMDAIREYNRDYSKLWIHPFYAIPRLNPPTWYNRLLLEAMIDVYLDWFEKMKNENQDFYLKIWLYEPNFINSQVVVAYKDFFNFYDNTFDKHTKEKAFPIEKYATLKDKLDLFNWEPHINANIYHLRDLEEDIQDGIRTEEEVRDIINQSYKTEEIELNSYEEEIIYKVNVGDVWVGSLKNN
ncbi:MAG TPA: hypothetical protein GX497_02435 [Bacillus bacterium]|nr:hypothetical protein [Bacillus sp. (in: firmicutes)]